MLITVINAGILREKSRKVSFAAKAGKNKCQ
jgi:hypothetical protein